MHDYLTIIREYKLPWIFFRGMYYLKLKIMRTIPLTERIFEKKVNVCKLEFFSIDIEGISKFLNSMPDIQKRDLIKDADDACEGIIKVFSSQKLNYRNPINWHFNPITQSGEDNHKKWYLIQDFNINRGDIKLIWEPSRFSHFYLFSRAYLLTKDIKYYKAFSSQMNHWLEQNHYSFGANYKCGQECSLRMINAYMTYQVFKQSGLTTGADDRNIKQLITDSYKKVCSNFFYAQKCIKNNHTLSELCGMLAGAWFCGDIKRIGRVKKMLNQEIHRQFMEDGGYIQYSYTYQRFALQLMEFILKIESESSAGRVLDNESRKKILKSAIQLYQLQNDYGDLPNYGSNDGALIFPVTSCGYRDFRPVLQTVISQLSHKRVFEPGIYDEELLWFYHKAHEIQPIQRRSAVYPDSGIYILRSISGFAVIYLQTFHTRPSHMDQLHVDIWHMNINIFCDCGTYSYADKLGDNLSSTQGHNVIYLEGTEQMRKMGNFMIYKWTVAEQIHCSDSEFEGVLNSPGQYRHKRKIKIEKYGYCISDYVSSASSQYCILFHTPCQPFIDSGKVILKWQGQIVAVLITDGLSMEIGSFYRSLYYMTREMIYEIRIISEKEITNTKVILHGGIYD